MADSTWVQRLKTRWHLNSGLQVVLVLLVFACTGFTVMFLKAPLYRLAGIDAQTPAWLSIPFYLIAVLPIYQVVLLFYGFVFGQFRFFWNFEKRMFARMFRHKKSEA